MAKMTEKEADIIRKEFGNFMTGNSTTNSLFSEAEMTMHTDTHTDTHSDIGALQP
jgi:hypothetical protein